uniref:Uncharacterized protein n=1 Tax=Leersia perrieri TaxID=77586 RepID=A0A0D9UWE4_9ORYZ
MKRTRAQQPKLQEADGAVAGNTNPKPQRRAKQTRQPKPSTAAAKKSAAAAVAAATVASAAAALSSPVEELPPTVPDVCGGAGNQAGAATATVEWDLDGGSSWWTFGVEEEKLLGWFPFVEEDFGSCLAGGGRAGDAEMAFDDDIWRIHQIYEIPNYAAK